MTNAHEKFYTDHISSYIGLIIRFSVPRLPATYYTLTARCTIISLLMR